MKKDTHINNENALMVYTTARITFPFYFLLQICLFKGILLS